MRRGVSTVGPHRDELGLTINGLPARTHASQGEQRTPGAGPAARRPPAGRRADGFDAGARARRRAVRARQRPGDGAARPPPRRPGRHHDGRVGAGGGDAGPRDRAGRRRHGGRVGRHRRPDRGSRRERRRSGAGHRRARRAAALAARAGPAGPRSAACSAGGRRRSARRWRPTSGRCAWSTGRCWSRSTIRRGRPRCGSSHDDLRARLADVTGVEVARIDVRVRRPAAAESRRRRSDLPPGVVVSQPDRDRVAPPRVRVDTPLVD